MINKYIYIIIFVPFNFIISQQFVKCDSLFNYFNKLYNQNPYIILYENAPQVGITDLYIEGGESNNLIEDTTVIFVQAIIDTNSNVLCTRFLNQLSNNFIEKLLQKHIRELNFKPGTKKRKNVISFINFPVRIILKNK
jgi:hypothetical protein